MKKILITMLMALAIPAMACTTKDAWTGPDKNKHFAVGVAMGTAGTLVFKDPKPAFITASLVGLGKEIYDSRGHGTCSFQDFAVTALGAGVGAYGTAWIVTPKFVGYAKAF